MVVTREERARRAAAFEVRSAGRDQEAAEFAGSKRMKKKADERLQTALRKQGEIVVGRNMLTAGSAAIAPKEEPTVVVVQPKAVAVVPDPPIFKLASFEIGPRASVVNVPMTFMFTKQVIGSLMIMDGRRLMMAISFQPGDHPDLSRAWTVPRWSRLTLRAHTGRGTLEAGESVRTRGILPVIPSDEFAQPGDSFWDGMKRGFEWAAPQITDMWEDWLGLDGNVF